MNRSSGKRDKRLFPRVLITICIIVLISVSAAAYFLKRGIAVERFRVGPIVITDCSLIWKDKLELQVSEISASLVERPPEKTSDTNFVRRGIQGAHYLARFFSKFSIERLTVGQKHFAVDLHQQSSISHILALSSDDLIFRSLLTFNKDTLDVEIIDAVNSRFNSEFKGKLQLDGHNDRATGTITVLINGSFPLSVDLVADNKQLSFQGKEAGEINEITSLVKLFGLSHKIQRWITDYLSGSRYHLKSFSGTVPWDNPKEILSTLDAEVRVDDTEYTFAPGLEPIKAQYTKVYFQKGVLIIKPHDATFCGQSGGESWLDIDFKDPKNILLRAYIKTRAVANEDILNLLDYYNIRLPFKQVEGQTATDLQLAILLNRTQVSAQGSFEIDAGAIEWDGKKFRTTDTRIELENSDVSIKTMNIAFADNIAAQVSGSIQAREQTGDLDLILDKLVLRPEAPQISLDASEPAHAHYHFGPDGHRLEVQPSAWQLDSTRLELGAFRAPVLLDDLAMQVPPVQLALRGSVLSEISGYVSVRKKQIDFTCDLLEYQVKDLQLSSPHIAIDVDYDNGLDIKTAETSEWTLGQMEVTLYPSDFFYHNDIFTVNSSRISYGTLFDSYLEGHYNLHQKKGSFSLEKIDVTNENLEKKLEIGKKADVEVIGAGGKFVFFFPQFDLRISTDEEKNWSAVFGDLSSIHSRSEFLQKLKIHEGSLAISSVNGNKPYHFSAEIKLPYPLLVEDDLLVDQAVVVGKIADEGVYATINGELDIVYQNKALTITSRQLGYNINAVKQLLDDIRSAGSESAKTQADTLFPITLHAQDSQVYVSPKSRLLADSIDLTFAAGKVSAKLKHGPGYIQLDLDKDIFLLNGKDLNDIFMGAMIQNARFKGGSMSMASKGSVDNFSSIFELHDTNLNGLATVNNVMAFLNTIPALMMFSLPEYSSNGLPIDSAVAGVIFDQKVATFESLEVHAPELQAIGTGQIDFSKRQIDMDVAVKTQASKNVGKIPFFGYVLAGDDDDATLSLKISGGFDDPEVSNSLVKDIVSYPAEVLYRTLKLPFHLAEKYSNQPETATGENSPIEKSEQAVETTNRN